MKCISLGLLVAVAAAATGVRAQETRTQAHWFKSEIRFYRLDSESNAEKVRASARALFAASSEHAAAVSKGRLDDFYPGTPSEPAFDEARLDDFYPEGAPTTSSRLSRGAKIGIGVGVSVLVVGAAVGGATAAAFRPPDSDP